jgi:hypothetical protein
MSDSTIEAKWMKHVLEDLGESVNTIQLLGDSRSAQVVAESGSKRAKYIDIRYHHMQEQIRAGEICLEHVSGDENTADILTKPLPKHLFHKHRKNLGVY